jgi:hypothetical protein
LTTVANFMPDRVFGETQHSMWVRKKLLTSDQLMFDIACQPKMYTYP